MTEEKISLYFKDSRSDKVYHMQLVQVGVLWSFNYQNGRRGGTLASGTKTPVPVAYVEAKKAYDKKLKEQLGKRYTPGESGTAFVGGALEERFTGVLVQLLNAIAPEDAEQYLQDPNWVLQEKQDGNRRSLAKSADELVSGNRKGMVAGLPQTVIDAVGVLTGGAKPLFSTAVLDGELMGEVLAVFDILEVDGVDMRPWPLFERLEVLERLKAFLEEAGTPGMFGVQTAHTEAEKRAMFAALKAQNAEGGVFKRLGAAYVPGRPNSGGDQLKLKFTKDATVIVEKLHATKRSVHLALLDAAGAFVSVGKCTVPPNQAIPKVGDLIEVNYLYAYRGGSLFQPIFKGPRDDIERSACTLSQLQYKAGAPDDESEDS